NEAAPNQNLCRQIRRCYSIPASPVKKYYDVVISGGGLVGTAAACALAADPILQKLSVLVIEPREPTVWNTAPERFSNRVFSITPGSRKFFEELSLWDTIAKLRVKPVRKLQVWESSSDAAISFEPANLDDISYIVEEPVLSTALWTRLRQLDRVQVLHNVKATSYDLPSRRSKLVHGESSHSTKDSQTPDTGGYEAATVTLSDGSQVETSLLIGADGPQSEVRQAMGIQNVSWSYRQRGLVATVHLSEPQDNSTAWQRFTSSGPVALLPLDEKRSSLVWSTSEENAMQLLKMDAESFLDALNRALWDEQDKMGSVNVTLDTLSRVLQKCGIVSRSVQQLPPTLTGLDENSRAVFPLSLAHATKYVLPCTVLIGDAAHRIHPLAGLGVNLGFGDVMDLRKRLREAVQCGYEVNSIAHLLKYETDAQRRVVPVMATVDLLHRLYGTRWNPIVTLRSVGLNFINSLDPFKRNIIAASSR
ncbi:ubiquinone biosynthesis monooxygenase COQ6, mitochondrial-like, partial [Paramacrobiotus metropolitanus]|uniref:ubiquinone biosynthesis monooxygenase COQ6, mitochondrial-like n=1 Tax=Paramacrobiotus metropolitanus TaxID=2943436 RepID=UPI0024463079